MMLSATALKAQVLRWKGAIHPQNVPLDNIPRSLPNSRLLRGPSSPQDARIWAAACFGCPVVQRDALLPFLFGGFSTKKRLALKKASLCLPLRSPVVNCGQPPADEERDPKSSGGRQFGGFDAGEGVGSQFV